MISELSVVIPIYSEEGKVEKLPYFRDTVGSALNQTYTDFSLIIVDDGNTWETRDYFNDLQREDLRVTILETEKQLEDKKTSARAVNLGLDYSFENGAEYYCYLHSDDMFGSEDSLERRIEELNGKDMVFGRLAEWRGGKLNSRKFPNSKMNTIDTNNMLKGSFPHHTSMWSRNLMELMRKKRRNEVFDESLHAFEDYDVTLYSAALIRKYGFSLGFVDNLSYIWVQSRGNITELSEGMQLLRDKWIIFHKEEFRDLPLNFWKDFFLERPGFFLPSNIKKYLRPLKNLACKLSRSFCYEGEEIEVLDIDPYWFKKKELVRV